MTDAGFFRGTSAEQDNRFSDKEKKLLKQMRFGENVMKKVDMSKVKLEVLRPWIGKRVEDMLGMEDDVIVEFVVNQLEANQSPDGRRIQINLTGFLNGKNARIFTTELWDMLLSAQEQATGIPASLIESKQNEIKKRNEEQEKLNETLKKHVSRFSDRLRNDLDTSPQSSPSSNIKKERLSPDTSRDRNLDVSFRRKDESSRRQYRARRSRSPSPRSPRKSRSRSRSKDRDSRTADNSRRSRDKPRDRSPRESRRRDRSRSPIQVRHRSNRSPFPRENAYRPSQRDRERPGGQNRRHSDHYERASNDSRRETGGRREEFRFGSNNSRQNGSQFRRQPSPGYRNPERSSDGVTRPELEREDPRETRAKHAEGPDNLDLTTDLAQDATAKKSKKEKKNKKEKKKHKKHKKTKKTKKSKGNGNNDDEPENENDEEDDDDDKSSFSDSNDDENSTDKDKSSRLVSLLRLVDPSPGSHKNSEDLEKRLREKALESLKKANLSSGNINSTNSTY